MKEATCCLCGVSVVAADDDNVPKCEKCQGVWSEALLVQSIMAGEMDHLLPIEGESDREEEED